MLYNKSSKTYAFALCFTGIFAFLVENSFAEKNNIIADAGDNITLTSNVVVDAGSINGVGLLARNGGIITTLGKPIVTIKDADDLSGLVAASAGQIHFSGNIEMTSGSDHIAAYAVDKNSQIYLDDVSITMSASLDGGHAIELENYGEAFVTNTVIRVDTERAEAVWVHDGGRIDIDANITTTGRGSAAISVDNAYSGSGGVRGYARVRGEIETFGNGFWGASQYFIGSHGIQARFGDVLADANIKTHGDGSFGIYSLRSGFVDFSGTIQTSGNGSHGVMASNGGSAHLRDVNISADADKDSFAILAQNVLGTNGRVPPGYNDASNVTGNGVMNIDGAIKSGRLGSIDLTMKNASLFDGYTILQDDGFIALRMQGARWNMLQNSQLTVLDMDEASSVHFSTKDNMGQLVTDDLAGNGTFYMRTAIAELSGDLLTINKSSQGNHNMRFDDSSSGSATGLEQLMVVQYTNSDQTDNQATFKSGGADVGAYHFGLEKLDDGNWYLVAQEDSGSGGGSDGGGTGGGDGSTSGGGGAGGNNGTTGNDGKPVVNPSLNQTAQLSVGMLNINYLINYAETQTLLQRMGELRQSPYENDDVWVRGFGGIFDQFSGSRLSGFELDYGGLQFGVDRKIESESGNFFVGVMGGYTKANADYHQGTANTKSYHLGLYATYSSENGWYIDAVFKNNYMDNSLNTRTVNGYKVDGDGNSNGYSLSAELGQRFYPARNGVYLEPQMQLSYSYQSRATMEASTGLKTEIGSYNSVLGRASMILGYDVKNEKTPMNLYWKTGYVHEFEGDTHYTFNHNNRENYDFSGGFWDNSLGLNFQISQRHNIYFEGTYALGDRFDQKQILGGYRLNF